jgi:xanthine dehydrogenase YagS FAD-binding subunit
MRPFKYVRAEDVTAAVTSAAADPNARFLAGGTNLLDLMKEDVERPTLLVDVSGLDLTEVKETGEGVTIGALLRNTETANHPVIRRRYPLLSQAIVAGASAQIRNMATNGGNLLQRTRCPYFYDVAMPCNKREPGAGCGAREGLNRNHAILGWSEKCVATYPGDMANALCALEAAVNVRDAAGRERTIPIGDFHRLPGDTPEKDNILTPGELILSIHLPPSRLADHSFYLKVRDRASYAFALVAVAAGLEINGNEVKQARLVLGGVAHKPWRSREAEDILTGRPATEENFRKAADAALRDARPLRDNRFKVELGKRAVVTALLRAAGKV